MEVKRELLMAVSPMRVWRALTDVQELQRWACEVAEISEGAYLLKGPSVPNGQLGGRILELREGESFALVWALDGVDTNVEVSIERVPQTDPPQADFARVVITHGGIPNLEPGGDAWRWETTWMLWLRQLALWVERARTVGGFDYTGPLGATIERHVVVEADLGVVWEYVTNPDLRSTWFHETLGAEVRRMHRQSITFEWVENVSGHVTFFLEPMADGKTLVMVEHNGLAEDVLFDYHLGWQDYLVALTRAADRPLVRQTVWIDAKPATVWTWFTTDKAWRSWWNATTEIDLFVGGRMTFQDHGAQLVGRVTEIVPGERMSFTMVEEGTAEVREPFVITLDLLPEGQGTRVTVAQQGFDRLPSYIRERVFGGFRRGWADSGEIDRLAVQAGQGPFLRGALDGRVG